MIYARRAKSVTVHYQAYGYTRPWIVVGAMLLLGAAFMLSTALGSVDDPRAGVANAEAWALATLLVFALPIALVRARQSVRAAVWMLVLTVVGALMIDAGLYGYLAFNPPSGDAVVAVAVFIYPLIVLGGPFKVLLIEAIVLVVTSAWRLASRSPP